jgi:Xaa-Pro aminopeptidase
VRRLTLPPETDAFLVTKLHNIRYLTGFTGSNAMLLLWGGTDAILYTDPRYTVQSKQQVDCKIIIATGPMAKRVVKDVARRGVSRLGFEGDQFSYAQYEGLKKQLPSRTELKPFSGTIETLRMVKDAAEIALIRTSVNTNSRALENALKRLKTGITEAEFATEIDYQSRKLGAESPAFDTIVAAGERAALPHAHPGAAKITPGMLLIDMGAFQAGYASDMTRMVHLGKATPRYRKAYKAVLEAQLAAINAIRPGVKTAAVDKAAREVLKAHGLGKEFVHSTGHGLGLEIHEPPRIGKKDKSVLKAGMAITVEPGIYIEGWGGIRIEDTVLVTETGCEILTPTPKELREI